MSVSFQTIRKTPTALRLFVIEVMGTLIGSAVCPIALSIMSTRANRLGCIIAAWAGLACGLIAWLITAATLNGGTLTIDTTGQDYPMLAGNLAALGVGTIISVSTTLIWPENHDFQSNYPIESTTSIPSPELESDEKASKTDSDDEKSYGGGIGTAAMPAAPSSPSTHVTPVADEDSAALRKAFRFAVTFSLALTAILIILIPLPLFFSSHIYSVGGFTGWVAVSFVWVFVAVAIVVLYPLWESRTALKSISGGIIRDIGGGGKRTAPATSGSA